MKQRNTEIKSHEIIYKKKVFISKCEDALVNNKKKNIQIECSLRIITEERKINKIMYRIRIFIKRKPVNIHKTLQFRTTKKIIIIKIAHGQSEIVRFV